MINISKPHLGQKEKDNVLEVLDSGIIAQGSKVKEFEEKFSNLCGTKFAAALNSGTAAIHTALNALNIKEGDEVITTPFSFIATASPIIMQKAKPVFVDIDSNTFNIDPNKVKEKITDKTKAIIAVDLYGQIYDTSTLNPIAKEHNIPIIEDACQAHGAELGGKKAGSVADIGCFSFYATKNMTTGEGGMVTTNSEDLIESTLMFRNHGQSKRYEYHNIGYNYRMTDIAAAIGLAQLEKFQDLTNKRIENANKLTSQLKQLDLIQTPVVKEGAKHVFHQYTIKVKDNKRDGLAEHLKNNDVGSNIYYPKPLHLFLKNLGYKEGDFPVTEALSKEVLSLPVHPSLTEEDINKIITSIQGFK